MIASVVFRTFVSSLHQQTNQHGPLPLCSSLNFKLSQTRSQLVSVLCDDGDQRSMKEHLAIPMLGSETGPDPMHKHV